ncbi:hypothetical protein B0H16DRAFT_1888295 [Mycena metata]|uniref:Uncharacterized protein n=1 Tax=Mycena metata TaxID=1033252 RepID=A0AAD7N7H8_9AGAR|nr:hypothetical protein B0H16DRAFT_1888295 [Mycena metata]
MATPPSTHPPFATSAADTDALEPWQTALHDPTGPTQTRLGHTPSGRRARGRTRRGLQPPQEVEYNTILSAPAPRPFTTRSYRGGDGGEQTAYAFQLRLDLNVDVELRMRARVRGCAVLGAVRLTPSHVPNPGVHYRFGTDTARVEREMPASLPLSNPSMKYEV